MFKYTVNEHGALQICLYCVLQTVHTEVCTCYSEDTNVTLHYVCCLVRCSYYWCIEFQCQGFLVQRVCEVFWCSFLVQGWCSATATGGKPNCLAPTRFTVHQVVHQTPTWCKPHKLSNPQTRDPCCSQKNIPPNRY